MSMKKQPEGVIRTARVAGEKPPQSYDLWLRTDNGDNDGKAYLGWSERLPRGMWQAHPADGSDPATIPPFREHTALVEFLLSIYKGLENTSEGGSAREHGSVAETAAILADPEAMAAIAEAQAEQEGEDALEAEQSPDDEQSEMEQVLADPAVAAAIEAGDPDVAAAAAQAVLDGKQITEDAIADEYGPAMVPDEATKEQGDGGHKPDEGLQARKDVPSGGEAEFRAAVRAELGAQSADGDVTPRPQNVVAGQVVGTVPFRAPDAPQSPQDAPAPEAGPPHDPGQVLFRPPGSAGDDPGGPSPREAGPPAGPAAPAPADFWGTVGGTPPPPDENMS